MPKRRAVIVALTGGALAVLSPVAGVGLTALFTSCSFSAAGSVPAESRAAHVANGIDSAMSYTIAGGAVGAVGLVTVVVGLILLLRAHPADAPDRP